MELYPLEKRHMLKKIMITSINPREFIVDIPNYHPLSPAFVSFWREQKKRCIEGHWAHGRYMPGKLYFYINFGTIKRKERGRSPYFGKPDLRDLEWELFYNWAEARGFSSFSEDTQFTSLRFVEEMEALGITEPPAAVLKEYPDAINPENGLLKRYIPARENLRMLREQPLGYPLFNNDAKNMMMLGCHPIGTQVRMFDNSIKNIEDINIGDELMGIDDVPRIVKRTIRGPQARMYRVCQSNGDDYSVTHDHELEILDKGKRTKIKAEKLFEIQNSICTEHFNNRYKGFKRDAVDLPYQEVPLDPYFLGIWLGDGHRDSRIITTSDIEIVYFLSRYADEIGGKLSMYSNNYSSNANSSNYKVNIIKDKNYIIDSLKSLRVLGNKHIPEEYLNNSIEVRMKLLAGLLDTDGTLDISAYRFYQADGRFAKQVQELANSLGFHTNFKYRKRHNTKEYSITISGDINKIPVQIHRKKTDFNPVKNYKISSLRIEASTDAPYYGVETDQDHSYCLRDYTMTGNSRGFG